MHTPTTTILLKRLFPLYVALFFQGVVLWYALEKLFMRQIGFDDAGIGFMVAAYSAIMLLFETPSGILADRWSRKGVLILSCVLLAASSLVGGLSESVPMYLVCAGLWGIFFAMYSGAYESIIYDTLLEAEGDSKNYEKYLGRSKVVDSAALVLGSLAGGVLASKLGIEWAYYLTVPMALASGVALFFFKEPELHKKHADSSIREHVKHTFQAVLQRGRVLYILAMLVILSTISFAIFEFSQLWWIALGFAVVLFGPSNAGLLATIGLGGFAAAHLRMHRYWVMQVALGVMLLCALGLSLIESKPVVVACQIVLSTGAVALIVVFNKFLHDALPSKVRAGAASAVSTLTRVLLIPLSLVFGYISDRQSVFTASWMLVALLGVAALVVSSMFRNTNAAAGPDLESINDTEEYQK